MAWQKIVRLTMKIVIAFITLSVALTSIVGGISIVLIASDIENNFYIAPDGIQANFGAEENNISVSINLTNDGYFAFENFTLTLKVEMENKTSAQEIIFLDREIYQNNLEGKNSYDIYAVASSEYFNNQSLLDDMGGSMNDPEVDALIALNSSLEPLLRPLSFPYILNSYDILITLAISSSYNLGLIDFGLDIQVPLAYEDYFAVSYSQLKQDLKDLYGL